VTTGIDSTHSPDSWSIRRAGVEDVPAAARLHVRSWQAAYRGQLPQSFLDRLDDDIPRREEIWRRIVLSPASETEQLWVTVEDEAIRGFLYLCPTRDEDADEETGELGAIYLDPDYWGRGIGKRLMEKATEELKALGFKQATLWVLDTNERARSFYEGIGWRADGASKKEQAGPVTLNEVRYRTSLEK
jgi:GNAT superfamily N-acetyltransferase